MQHAWPKNAHKAYTRFYRSQIDEHLPRKEVAWLARLISYPLLNDVMHYYDATNVIYNEAAIYSHEAPQWS